MILVLIGNRRVKMDKRMKVTSISGAVRQVIDSYLPGHQFHGNSLHNDVARVFPEARRMYTDTILRMARRHRRGAFRVAGQNKSLYEKV